MNTLIIYSYIYIYAFFYSKEIALLFAWIIASLIPQCTHVMPLYQCVSSEHVFFMQGWGDILRGGLQDQLSFFTSSYKESMSFSLHMLLVVIIF